MFNFLKKKPVGEKVVFKISGMHCTSCSMSIDGELEDVAGVLQATTSYAASQTTIEYDPTKVQPKKLKAVIEGLKYTVE